jgi:hypothetical protein
MKDGTVAPTEDKPAGQVANAVVADKNTIDVEAKTKS